MIAEWDRPAELQTPKGTLKLNYTDPSSRRRFQLNPGKCAASLPVRSTEDDVPQGDGKLPHRRWRGGYQAHLAIEPLIGEGDEAEPACGADLVEMLDLLGLHLNAMIRTGLVSGLPNARYLWTPSGHADRMLDRCQLLSVAPPALGGELGGIQVEVDIDSPYPYYIEAAERDDVLYGAGTEILTNPGNVDFFPVVEIYGASSGFTLKNLSVLDIDGNPLQIVYDSTLPGAAAIAGGHYIEFAFFQNTAYLDGNVAGRKAGIDMRVSDFFPLAPGANELELTGATGLVKWNGAWA